MGMMSSTCSNCDSEAVASMVQTPFCGECGREKLAELEERRGKLEEEVESAQEKYDRLKDEYGVRSFGHIDHQFNVTGREDIDESDVQAVSDAEEELQDVKQKLNGVKAKIQDLESDLD